MMPSRSRTPVIRMRDVTKVFSLGDIEVHALRGVSLEIARGELVAIMGPSGSGKSTLMNIVGCLDQPTNGSYELDGVELRDGLIHSDELVAHPHLARAELARLDAVAPEPVPTEPASAVLAAAGVR